MYAFGLPGILAVSADRVVVVCNCSVDAYKEALEGIRQVLGREPELVTPGAAGVTDATRLSSANQNPGNVYIAIGRDALHYAVLAKPDLSVVGTMMLRADAAAEGAPSAGEIDLDTPPRLLLQEVHRLFPHQTRLGILVSGNVDRAALLAPARELGLAVQLTEVNGPANLLKAFLSFKGKADLVLTLPDNALYNGATVKPLVMASLEERIPIIGFSAAFVRAGAAAGVFADFHEAGRQAAEAALRYAPGRTPHTVEQPRKLTVAVNQRVLRLLGLDYERNDGVAVYR
jgi:putative ABC transport system substrate-binding protein